MPVKEEELASNFFFFFGEGTGDLLQSSCLENPVDGGV